MMKDICSGCKEPKVVRYEVVFHHGSIKKHDLNRLLAYCSIDCMVNDVPKRKTELVELEAGFPWQ